MKAAFFRDAQKSICAFAHIDFCDIGLERTQPLLPLYGPPASSITSMP